MFIIRMGLGCFVLYSLVFWAGCSFCYFAGFFVYVGPRSLECVGG